MFAKVVRFVVLAGSLLLAALVVALLMLPAARDKFNRMNTPRKPWWVWLTSLLVIVTAIGLTVCAWCDRGRCQEMCFEIYKGIGAGLFLAFTKVLAEILAKKLPEDRVDVNAIFIVSLKEGLVSGYLLGLLFVAGRLLGI